MAETLRIFVSATNDLESERAIIGKALADLPIQIRAEIRRTPASGGRYDDIYELIANVDRHYFLLGRDITAPAGAEWDLAWQLERSVLPLYSGARLSPAAREFKHNSFIKWQEFHSPPHLASIVTLDLIKRLNNAKNRYGLTVVEMETLRVHGERLQKKAAAEANSIVALPGGAEGGGVLLDNLRQDPIDAVLVNPD
ncbi:MAG: hypothetical protein AAF702_33910 [Chloroflexota bacterium]